MIDDFPLVLDGETIDFLMAFRCWWMFPCRPHQRISHGLRDVLSPEMGWLRDAFRRRKWDGLRRGTNWYETIGRPGRSIEFYRSLEPSWSHFWVPLNHLLNMLNINTYYINHLFFGYPHAIGHPKKSDVSISRYRGILTSDGGVWVEPMVMFSWWIHGDVYGDFMVNSWNLVKFRLISRITMLQCRYM